MFMKTLGVGTSRDKWYSSVVYTCQWVTEPGPVKADYMGTCTWRVLQTNEQLVLWNSNESNLRVTRKITWKIKKNLMGL